jgi:hypothetical protein
MRHDTSIVDRVLIDPMAIPAQVDVWLREIEMRARELHGRVYDALREAGVPVPVLKEVVDELDRFLADPQSSPLHRLLRRPLSQLASGTPASSAFSRYTSSLFERAAEAINVQKHADALRAELEQLRRDFQTLIPRATTRALQATRLTEASVLGAGRSQDLRAMLARAGYVRSELRKLADHVPPGIPLELAGTAIDAPSVGELEAMLRLRLRRRESAVRTGMGIEDVRQLAALQLKALVERSPERIDASRPQQVLAESLLGHALRAGAARVCAGKDTELWTTALSAADRMYWLEDAEDAWHPRVPLLGSRQDGQAGPAAVFFALPLDEEYVLLSQHVPTVVRMWSGSLDVGATVDCRVFGIAGAPLDAAAAALDLDPLFEGRRSEPAWYQTERRAKLEIIAATGEHVFARLVRRGKLQRLTGEASRSSVSVAGALRVLSRPQHLPKSTLLRVEALPENSASFAGVVTTPVRAPIAELDRALLRTTELPGGVLEREREVFRALRWRSAVHAPAPLPRGQMEVRSGYLYVPPIAFRIAESSPLGRWADEEPLLFVRAAAQVMVAAHEAGYALAIYHPDAFAFGMFSNPASKRFEPRAVLMHAAAAVPLGERYRKVGGGPLADICYIRIGYRGAALPVAAGETSSCESDAAAFGLLVLEFLAKKSLHARSKRLSWDELESVIQEHEDAFHHPKLARTFAEWILSRSDRTKLLAGVRRLAAGVPAVATDPGDDANNHDDT